VKWFPQLHEPKGIDGISSLMRCLHPGTYYGNNTTMYTMKHLPKVLLEATDLNITNEEALK
jgi:hypothetical protein